MYLWQLAWMFSYNYTLFYLYSVLFHFIFFFICTNRRGPTTETVRFEKNNNNQIAGFENEGTLLVMMGQAKKKATGFPIDSKSKSNNSSLLFSTLL